MTFRSALCLLALIAAGPSAAQAQPLDRPGLAAAAGRVHFQKTAAPALRAVADDPVNDGVAKGAVLGAVAGLGLAGAMYLSCGRGCEAPSPGPVFAGCAGVGAGGGALIGWLIDKAHKPRASARAIAVSPVVTGPRKGVVVSVGF